MKIALAGAAIVIGFTAIGLVVSGRGDRIATAWRYLFGPLAPSAGTSSVPNIVGLGGYNGISGIPTPPVVGDPSHLPGGWGTAAA